MTSLKAKGFAEPLKKYIASGKPYMGICIGMQALCESSDESDVPGLGIVPTHVGKFSNATKAVPCMGWNGATLLKQVPSTSTNGKLNGLGAEESYYFVHSYRVAYDEKVKDWALSVTKYGDEIYVSSFQKGNVFATQFHPEKSGKAGLALLKAWLGQTDSNAIIDVAGLVKRAEEDTVAEMTRNGFTKRIVACLDVRANDQ